MHFVSHLVACIISIDGEFGTCNCEQSPRQWTNFNDNYNFIKRIDFFEEIRKYVIDSGLDRSLEMSEYLQEDYNIFFSTVDQGKAV